jgi:hypothetical protein
MDSPLLHSDHSRIEQLVKILRPFKVQTDEMQTDNMALSHVIPCLFELTLHVRDPTLNKTVAQSLLCSLRKRFECFLDPLSDSFDPLPSTACFLDPAAAICKLRDETAKLLT